ncbi:MAG: hypothetical protein IIV68_06400 [Alistipes sp.]|jgi:hypothetical protein|nr:hypothetical protein [Alistipes sp.]
MDKIKLCFELLLELLCLKRLNLGYRDITPKNRTAVTDHSLLICLHEWGGYPLVRYKHINSTIRDWQCGLEYQLERFEEYRGEVQLDLTITISEVFRCRDLSHIARHSNRIIPVSNRGMDFAGYAAFYESKRGAKNCYVLLTNSSVSSLKRDFIDSYIAYMEHNTDIGMLGISCCSTCYQSFVINNFTPHLQSFFLLTTLAVLDEAVALNGGNFPGVGVVNKQLLIRRGEIHLSQLVLRLGYKLAVVTESGVVKFDNNPDNWPLPWGDYRAYTLHPNAINTIREI